MDDKIKQAIAKDENIDITTIGRKSGKPRRIEIWFHNINGKLYITGTPGKRDWYANMLANPRFTFHLKDSVTADLEALARPITDEVERRTWFENYLTAVNRMGDFDEWFAGSPLVEVTLVD